MTDRIRQILAAAVLAALPATLALAQGQIDTSRGNDANNRIGSGGRNNYYYNGANPAVINTGNRVVTGNVTMGREFRGNVGYSDPFAFRGRTAGAVSDNFTKNSAGVPVGNAPPPVPNRSTSFYGQSQTVAPPPGYALTPNNAGYVPAPAPTAREFQDRRVGVVNLNAPLAPVPTPGEMMTTGNLNPQQAAQQLGIITGSPLYGVREWNPQDPADRLFLENLMNRQQNGGATIQNAREIQRMREELEKLDPTLSPQQNAGNDLNRPVAGAITPTPLGRTLDTPNDPAMVAKPINDQVAAKPVNAAGFNTDQSVRFNLIGSARRTSTQYTELSKRLEQFYADRPKTDADAAREFNAELREKMAADAKAAAAAAAKLANNNPGNNNPITNPAKPEDPTKPKTTTKKPAPIKIGSLAEGIRGEGLGNVMKKAEGLMKEGKYASALDQYDQAEAVTPNNPFIWLGRANAELGAGFYARAEAHLRQALSTDKALLMGQYDLTGMLGEERLGKVVAELKEVANKDQSKAGPLFLLAYVAYNTGHERQALGYLDLAEKRGGDQAGFYKTLREHWALPDDATKPEQNK